MLLTVLSALSVAFAGCGSTGTTDIIPPITGVVVRAEPLSSGRGCGTAPGQLFKYTVLVFGLNPADQDKPQAEQRRDEFVAGNIYDCFTDGAFVDLPTLPVPGGSIYAMEVYAYNRPAYVAALGTGLETTLRRLQDNRVALLADGGGAQQRSAIEADLKALRATKPTYSTTCSAEQLGLVQSVAVCKQPQLNADPASVELRLATFTKGGTTVACDDQYVSVRVTYTVGGVRSAPTEKRCSTLTAGGLVPETVTISPAQAPASYVFDVTLLRSDGAAIGSTTCGAETSPGLTSVAGCKPIP